MWRLPDEKNTRQALGQAHQSGFGAETDVRDRDGVLVISHDLPNADAPSLSSLLDIYRGSNLTLAINVKADGLSAELAAAFEQAQTPWFTFDMSAPEMVRYVHRGLPVFTRHSDVEPEPILYAEAQGVWLDGFHSDWWSADVIRRHLDRGKRVCVVSPELHGRSTDDVWERLARLTADTSADGLMLCTDFPDRAREAFGT